LGCGTWLWSRANKPSQRPGRLYLTLVRSGTNRRRGSERRRNASLASPRPPTFRPASANGPGSAAGYARVPARCPACPPTRDTQRTTRAGRGHASRASRYRSTSHPGPPPNLSHVANPSHPLPEVVDCCPRLPWLASGASRTGHRRQVRSASRHHTVEPPKVVHDFIHAKERLTRSARNARTQ
jgi:hypothetical protein